MTNPYLDPHGPVLSDPAAHPSAAGSRWQMPTAATDPAHRPAHPRQPIGAGAHHQAGAHQPGAHHQVPAPHPHAPGDPPTQAELQRPAIVTIACLLQWLNSALLMAGGVWIIGWLLGQARPDPWTTIMPFMVEMIVLLLAVSGATLIAAGALIAAFTVAALRGARWPRWVLAVLNVLTLLFAVGVAGSYISGESLVRAGMSESGAVAVTVTLAAVAILLMLTPVVLLFLRPTSRWLAARSHQRAAQAHQGAAQAHQQPVPPHQTRYGSHRHGLPG